MKLGSIQYNAALAITGAIRGTSREKIFSGLGLETLKDRPWFRKLCVFYKILNNMSPRYLSDIIPKYYQKIFFKKCEQNSFSKS